MKPSINSARGIAAQILSTVIKERRSLNQTFNFFLKKVPSNQQGFVKELCYGCLRWYFQLSNILNCLLAKPVKDKDIEVFSLLLIGLYQLLYLSTAEHAAVNETVNAARELKKDWATQLINGVLRNFQRNKEAVLLKIKNKPEAVYSHPSWLIDSVKNAWPEEWQSILNANNEHPPLSLRINRQKISYEDYLNLLKNQHIEFYTEHYLDNDVTLKKPLDIFAIPGFDEGLVSVQDIAAQLAAKLLDLQPHQNVLDACAAPGSKTTHILELEPGLKKLIAIDSDDVRLKMIQENLTRLDLKADLISADANLTETWWDGELFDRILLDAPCSATGAIRRHPDIKILRQKSDIEQFATQQKALLNHLWPLLKTGGLLLYVTCSILPEENEKMIEQFLKKHPTAVVKKIATKLGFETKFGRQLLTNSQHDGFYYCQLIKMA